MMEVFQIRKEIEHTQDIEELFPIQIDIQSKYDQVFENIKEPFDNQKYQEITERLKEAKYWEKILTEIEERKDQIKNQ